MRLLLILLILLPFLCPGQRGDFKFGKITTEEWRMNVVSNDTSAFGVVLDEFGKSFFNISNGNLRFEYHVRIKILKKKGLSLSDFSIPLYKYSNGELDLIHDLKASSFSLGPAGVTESTIEGRSVLTEKYEGGEIKKFAVPNVSVGSVIEVYYQLETPYIFNLRRWDFQGEIPKLHSAYWAVIPAYYHYNISLIGYLPLGKKDSEVMRDCFGDGVSCNFIKFEMDSIPAFRTEEYMTSKKNFMASIKFELAEVHHRSGYVDKVTKEWKDVAEELRADQRFGGQLRRGEDMIDNSAIALLAGVKDPLERARKVYDFVVKHYSWNGEYGKYCERGIRKAFEERKGNVGDLNLTLIAALRYAGLSADPVILSTRDNGYVSELFPVLSDFNYVIAKVNIAAEEYLLDATDPLLPFGMLPYQCLNGKGRVIGDKTNSWQEIQPRDKFKETNYIALSLGGDGILKGTVRNTYQGYDALNQRKLIYSFNSIEAYQLDLEKQYGATTVTSLEIKNLDDPTKPLIEILSVETPGFEESANTCMINPFLNDRFDHNPFKSTSRLYPVDLGAEIDKRITFTMDYPEGTELLNPPEQVGLSLPADGGKYVLMIQNQPGKVSISSWLAATRTLYTSGEYHYLRELFDRIMQIQNAELILKKS